MVLGAALAPEQLRTSSWTPFIDAPPGQWRLPASPYRVRSATARLVTLRERPDVGIGLDLERRCCRDHRRFKLHIDGREPW
jgi:hypothetical protein